MCKFTHRLFIFVALLQMVDVQRRAAAAPASGMPHKAAQLNQQLLSELLDQDYDYDLHYDQRQKGSENLRLKLDGFFIGLPAQETSGILLLTDDILEAVGDELLMGLGKSSTGSSISISSSPSTKASDGISSVQHLVQVSPPSDPLADMQTIVVEIPASQKAFEGRQQPQTQALEEGSVNNSRFERTSYNR